MVGSAIATRGAILLTGTAEAGTGAVNKCTVAGAASTPKATWVGVEKRTSSKVVEDRGRSLVLRPEYGHKRNYIEAHLCDAAIAFRGGEGSASEVAFCFALGRPVVLLGDWESDYPLERERPRGLSELRAATENRMKLNEVGPSPLDPLIDHSLGTLKSLEGSERELVFHSRPVPTSEQGAIDVVDLILRMLDERFAPPTGAVPSTHPEWIARARARAREVS